MSIGGTDSKTQILSTAVKLFSVHGYKETSILSQFELTDIDATMIALKRLFEFLESNRPQIKILFSELGKGSDYLTPVKAKISELQVKLGSLIPDQNKSNNSPDITRKLKIITDILLGMILSDYIFDFPSFQDDIHKEERKIWREDRIEMLIKILRQLSGLNTGKLTFQSVF